MWCGVMNVLRFGLFCLPEYVNLLNGKFRELGIGKYKKNRKDIFSILMEKGNLKMAIRYVKRMIEENKGKTPAESVPGTKL